MTTQIHSLPMGMVNCYLIQGEKIILIDAGLPGQIEKFKTYFKSIGIQPDEIELVVITHGHYDHTGSAKAIKEMTGAKIAIHQLEQSYLETGKSPKPPGLTGYGKALGFLMQFVPAPSVPGVKADMILDENGLDLHEFGMPGKIIHTPGHTQGSISVLLETGEAFVGDLAMSAKFMRLTPGLPIVGDDVNTVKQSWKKLLDLGAKVIYPAHGNPFPASVFTHELA